MKYMGLRIAANSVLVVLILISRLLLRRKRRITYFNAETGGAEYEIRYYTLLFIPLFKRKVTIPKHYTGRIAGVGKNV